MRITMLIVCGVLASNSYSFGRHMTLRETETSIDSVIGATTGTIAVAFKDLQTGKMIYRRPAEIFHAASTMKTAVMIEVFNQVGKKRFSFDDSILIVNSFPSIVDGSPYSLDISSDSDDDLYALIGKKESIRTLVFAMITVSSNLATNLLIERVGPANVQRTLQRLGVKTMRVLRGVEDGKAFEAGRNNTATAKGLARIFELLARRKVVSRKASDEMIKVLLRQKFNDMIPRLLPRNVKVAHKTGSITGVQHDSGIVFLPDGRKYVLVILSKDLKDAKAGIEAIAKISRVLYDYETG